MLSRISKLSGRSARHPHPALDSEGARLGGNLPDLLKQRILTRAEAGMLSHGYRRLAHIRIRLHLNAKRAEDRLLFDLQPQVAESMGYQDENRRRQSEELMRVFYRAVKTVKQLGGILTPMLRSRVSSTPVRVTLRIDDDYIQVNNQIAARRTDIFQTAEHIFKIVEIMQQRNDITALEPQTLRAWWGRRAKSTAASTKILKTVAASPVFPQRQRTDPNPALSQPLRRVGTLSARVGKNRQYSFNTTCSTSIRGRPHPCRRPQRPPPCPRYAQP